MSADEQHALLEKLLAAQQQPVAQQSADLVQGQVSAAQSALETAESNPEAPISDPLSPEQRMMTGTNPAVYADQQANYPNEYGSRADPDIEEPVSDIQVEEPEGESELEVEPIPVVSLSESQPVISLELGSDIQTAPDVSAPVSPELSEISETAEIAPEINSDIQEIASEIPDSPHLPIDLKTSNTDAADYETGRLQFFSYFK